MFHKKRLWVGVYGLLLILFTLYVLLDTFVITRVYSVLPEELPQGADAFQQADSPAQAPSQMEQEDSSPSEEAVPNNAQEGLTYDDGNISISIAEYRQLDTTIYVADVKLSSAKYLQTALAQNAYGRNVTETTSEIAEQHNAILAVNGDYYGAQEQGYVLKNGVLYRETAAKDQEDLVIYEDGSFEIIQEMEISAQDLLANGAQQILSFGPALIEDGEIAVTGEEEVGRAKASNPRTAIGIVEDLHYLFVVSDGRTAESAGLSLYQLAEFLQSLGAKTAYNLDGGGSSTMVFEGQVINNPTTNGRTIRERSVSDIVYIGT